LELGVWIEIGASTFSQQSTPAEIGTRVRSVIQYEEPQLGTRDFEEARPSVYYVRCCRVRCHSSRKSSFVY